MSTSPLPPDPYEALGLTKDTDSDAVKKAHRRLVLKHHPDRIKDPSQIEHNKNEFQKVQQAYEILIDPVKRQRYDDQVRLAQLRAERMMSERSERNTPRSSYTSTYPTRPAPPSHASYRDIPRDMPREMPREMRTEARYATEERAPDSYFDHMHGRFYEEPTIPNTNIRKAQHEKRPSTSKSTEKKAAPKSSGWDRRPGGLGMGAAMLFKEKAKVAKEKVAAAEDKRSVRAREAKARDKEERKGRMDKEQRTQAPYQPSYEDASDAESSDSDTIVYTRRSNSYRSSPRESTRAKSPQPPPRSMPRTRSPQPQTRPRSPVSRTRRHLTPEPPRNRAPPKQWSSEIEFDSDEDEWHKRHISAADYIKQSQVEGRVPAFERPPLSRQGSAHQYWEGQRGNLERDHRRSGSDSDRQRNRDSYGSRRDDESQSSRRPAMPSHTSAPSGLRGMVNGGTPPRMPTMEREMPQHRARQGSFDSRTNYRQQAFDQPELKRTSSDPVSPRMPVRKDTNPLKPSNLKQTETNHDSGYGTSSASHTPEMRGESNSPPPRASTTTKVYRAKKDEDDKHHRIRRTSVDARGRMASPAGKSRRVSPDPKSKRAVSPDSRAPKPVVEDGETNRHLRPEAADEKRERRRSRSRETEIRDTRSSSNRPTPATSRRPSMSNRETNSYLDPRPRGRAMTEDRAPDYFKHNIDTSKAKYATRNAPSYVEHRTDPSFNRVLNKPGRKASVY